ncbi:hypothetical protein SAMN05519103_06504 [Rhizobiales bacterium GAS113]|nr:hypothetical protein SAMN05519103_06504 [Rhizobiales bacterium GAS113]
MTVFNLQLYDGAYAVYEAHDDGAASWIYLLGQSTTQPPKTLALADAWARPGPWALIVRSDPWDFDAERPGDTAKTLGFAALAPSQASVLAWRADPGFSAAWWPGPRAAPEYQSLILDPTGVNRQVRAQTLLAFGNVSLTVPAAVTVSLGGDGSSLHFARTSNQLALGRTDARIGVLTYDSADLLASASGDIAAGGLKTNGVTWRARQVFLLGQDAAKVAADAVDLPEIRYWRDIGAAQLQRIRLPLFAAADFSTPNLGLNFALNPALPFDPSATRFDVSAATNTCFTASAALMTREGATVGLTPADSIGFHLAPGSMNGKNAVYLAPYGRFGLGAPAGGGSAPFRLMPGLSGLERIEAAPGDILELVPGQPAFGAASGPGVGEVPNQPPKLTSNCTTSWMRLTPTGAPSRPYFAQPLASVFYASIDGKALPRAADALVADLTGAEAAFPLAPYANAFLPNINPTTTPAAVADFEHVYLSGARGAILGSQEQPVFSIDGAALTVKGATPRGLMAEIGPTSVARAASAPTKGNLRRNAADLAATPAGQWRRLYLAKGVTSTVTLEPSAAGVVDPVMGNALLQPDLFLVYNNWAGHPIRTAGELDVGGFSFDWAPLDGKDPSMLMVAKFTAKVSLQDLFAMPERWRDAATLVGGSAAIAAAQKVFDDAMKTAQAARKAQSTLFDDFLQQIAGSPSWTGIVVFQAPVDGNAMPPTLQILVAGMRAPLRAHHLAVDVTVLATQAGVPHDLGPSSVAGVISYDDPGGSSPAGPGDDFGFYTQSLKVGIFGSVVTSFNAEVGVTAKRLFGRQVELRPQPHDPSFPDTFLLKGIYHIIANVPTVTFQVPDARVFDFPAGESLPGGGFNRILNRFEIDSAGILPQLPAVTDGSGNTTHRAQITLNGGLWFSADPFGVGVDLFSYGTEAGETPATGLGLGNFGLEMTFVLDSKGQRQGPPNLTVDYSRLAVSGTAAAVRPGGLMAGLPLKLKGILANDAGLDVDKLGGKPVHVLQIAGKETQTPHFALQFEMIIGSLGELSGVHAGLTAEMRLAWGPLDTTPDADGALLTVQLPGASGGFNDLNVQGMLKLVFGDANLLKVAYDGGAGGKPADVYAMLFNNVALSVMGIKLPPKVISDLILFSDPRNATGSSLAACLAVRQQ